MKSLRQQFEEIINPGVTMMDKDYCNEIIDDLLRAVTERDSYVIGGNHVIYEGSEYKGNKRAVNAVKASQRQRAQQTLGGAEDWTRNSI